ncbi:MAG: hypothetical protein K2X82_11205 [Gemmataceae bacterium]|nr:hypothetical protein [Gemmataceae bacterium]
MDVALLTKHFARIGARLKVPEPPRWASAVALDVRTDARGEFFEVRPPAGEDPDLEAVDVRPESRHLLLLLRRDGGKSKFLCGHDERHWFVAGVPEAAAAGTVRQAMDALKPGEVHAAQVAAGVRGEKRYRRKNAAYVRQGEWFFLPEPGMAVDPRLVLRDEPLTRGAGSKPHTLEFCYRTGGEAVWVCPRRPNGITEAEYRKLLSGNPHAARWGWRAMRRNPGVYVRGRVRHKDHATVTLNVWHRVVMNTEGQSRAMRNVAFLD